MIAVPAQAPALHVSFSVQMKPSSQGLVLSAYVHTPPTQLSSVQVLPSSHSGSSTQLTQPGIAGPPQAPLAQTSVSVQGSLSSQVSVLLVNTHTPTGHVSSVHGLASSQSVSTPQFWQPAMGVPAQVPVAQVSFSVQGSPSSHGAVLSLNTQNPGAWQISVVQGSLSSQDVLSTQSWHPGIGVPAHAPEAQLSSSVQADPSSQLPPSFAGAGSQAPVVPLQTPTLQASAADEQSIGAPLQDPETQTPFSVQRSPSSHGPLSLTGDGSHAPLNGLQTPIAQSVSTPEQSAGGPAQAPAAH